jgi:hypothetical protein
MGFTSFMGHRISALVLAFITILFFLAAGYYSPNSLIAPTPIKVWAFYIFAIISGIASAYFFKTQH